MRIATASSTPTTPSPRLASKEEAPSPRRVDPAASDCRGSRGFMSQDGERGDRLRALILATILGLALSIPGCFDSKQPVPDGPSRSAMDSPRFAWTNSSAIELTPLNFTRGASYALLWIKAPTSTHLEGGLQFNLSDDG